MTTLRDFIRSHGFDAFINSDDSVSFWLPYTSTIDSDGEYLITVRSWIQARIELGY